MKIKTKEISYEEFEKLPKAKSKMPIKQRAFFRWLIKTLAKGELKAVDFKVSMTGMEKIDKKTPCLYLMNHSSFTDLMIAGTILKEKQYHIVCTNDGFVGKEWLMRAIGCIPAKKFITDVKMVKEIKYAVDKLGSSILMFPEASYSFDGTETPLPDSLGKCVKLLGIPVVLMRTKGAFLRDPLYNCLQKRNVKVSCDVKRLLEPEEIKKMSVDEINFLLENEFKYDHFKEQVKDGVLIKEDFRADGLERVLYKCPECLEEGSMKGEKIHIVCNNCGKKHELKEDGRLKAVSGDTKFEYVTDWYAWERACVKAEVLKEEYSMNFNADIIIYADNKAVYKVGEGRFTHDKTGYSLAGCAGKLNYKQSPKASYSLYSDYYWYEIGDMICIGDTKRQYYCFPKAGEKCIVAKARLAAEEMFKIAK